MNNNIPAISIVTMIFLIIVAMILNTNKKKKVFKEVYLLSITAHIPYTDGSGFFKIDVNKIVSIDNDPMEVGRKYIKENYGEVEGYSFKYSKIIEITEDFEEKDLEIVNMYKRIALDKGTK